MADIDDFATNLLEEAKRFLERARESQCSDVKSPNLHAALMLAFCGFEAHVNAIADELANHANVSVHEKALLLERDVRLEDGEFVLKPGLRMVRLEDRVEFLHRRFSGSLIDHSETWWGALGAAVKLRNELTHPKGVPVITEPAVRRGIEAIIDTLNALYQAVYRRPFPAAHRGLQSRLSF